jgi:hypothetical protein
MTGIKCDKHGVRDCMLCRAKAQTVTAQPVELDPQAQEAAARIADTAVPEVDFGDVEAAWNSDAGKLAIDSAIIETAPHVDATIKQMMTGQFSTEPPSRIAPKGTHLAGNPIVDAAAAYASAQESVANLATQHADLSAEVRQIEEAIRRAQEDLDLKKKVLQSLVGGAS